MNTPVIILLV